MTKRPSATIQNLYDFKTVPKAKVLISSYKKFSVDEINKNSLFIHI